MPVSGAFSAASRRAATGFMLLATFALLLVVHGGRGYQQITVLVYAGTLILLVVASWFWVKGRLAFSKKQLVIASSIVLVSFLPACFGLLHFNSKSGFTFMVLNLVVFFFFSQVVKHFRGNAPLVLANFFVLTATVATVLAIILLFYPVGFMGVDFGDENPFRLTGTFSTPNRFGEVPASGSLAALFLFLADRERNKRWLIICLFFIFITLLSGSKGAILGLVVGLLAFMLLSKLMLKKVVWKLAVLLIPVVWYVGYLLYDFITLAMKFDKILEGRIDVGSGRTEIWARGAEFFWNSSLFQKIFGHGSTAFVSLSGDDAHSMYLDLLVNNGLLSLVFLIVVLASATTFVFVRNGDRKDLVFALALILFCFARGVAMPTVFNGFNFAMIAFWAGVSLIFIGRRQIYVY